MKKGFKSEKGAITLIVLVTMLFLISFLMSLYVRVSNKAQTSTETTMQIAEKYARREKNIIFSEENEVIPIYSVEELKLIGTGNRKIINGVVYTFSSSSYYALQNDLYLEGEYSNQWIPLPISGSFTGVLDGLGHTIRGLYINKNSNYQGLFGTLGGTVKNLNIQNCYIKGNTYVGSIAGLNNGTISNCIDSGIIIGVNYISGISWNGNGTITKCKNLANIIGDTNVIGGYFTAINSDEVETSLSQDMILTNNYKYISGEDIAIIPKGFKISASVYEQTISDGLVIIDNNGNEFVWVPVDVANQTSFNAIRTTNNDNNYIEPYITNNYNDEQTEYQLMSTSVINNGGFYIARYETGSTVQRTALSGITTIIVQEGAYPYNYVAWGNEMTNIGTTGAAYLSQNMYTGNDYGVASNLCYGVQWDATLAFIGSINSLVNNSIVIKNSGETSTDKAKNIFDLVGNLNEWTMESNSSLNRIIRGGSFISNGLASVRAEETITNTRENIGFRIALYIK